MYSHTYLHLMMLQPAGSMSSMGHTSSADLKLLYKFGYGQ